jgi:hypothetical protein
VTTDHVLSALFSNEFMAKVKGGNHTMIMSVIMKWVYYPFMEGVSKEWTEETVNSWIQNKGYKISVRIELKGEKKMRMHRLFKIVRKLVAGGFQQKVREQ